MGVGPRKSPPCVWPGLIIWAWMGLVGAENTESTRGVVRAVGRKEPNFVYVRFKFSRQDKS